MHTKSGAFITKCIIIINAFAMPPRYKGERRVSGIVCGNPMTAS